MLLSEENVLRRFTVCIRSGEDLDLNRTLSDLQALGNALEPQKKIDRLFRLCQSQHTLLKERTE